jgi:GNAT superfamily N-acetyltransferase
VIPLDKGHRQRISGFYQGYRWNYLAEAILEGTLGEALADNEDNPQVALLEIPKIKLFIPAGDATHPAARELMTKPPKLSAFIFASPEWEELFKEIQAGKLVGMERYAFTSEKLELEHLRKLAARIVDGYRLAPIDLSLAKRLGAERSEFASAHMMLFDSPEDFSARGFGFCVLAGDEIVSAASTFAVCAKGIEIQVSTREKQRGKGLATAVVAQLLIHSLQNGLDPNWDAENARSVGLAKKLGYTPQGNYTLWLVAGSRPMAGLVKAGLQIKEFFKQ